MSLQIRDATAADAVELARMRYEFRSEMSVPNEPAESFVERCTAWMRARLGQVGPWRCWIAGQGGGAAGHLWLQLIEKIPNPAPELERHAYVTNVFVRPAFRGNGAGDALLRTALDFCRQAGVDSVILWPTVRSRALYARHGFAVRDDLLEAVLHPGRVLHH